MQQERPYILSIAGFDPSAGAGVLADVKTFEQLGTYGLAVCTGMTLQTEDEFVSVKWRELNDVKAETHLLLDKYPVKAIKFGIVPSFDFLKSLVNEINIKDPSIQIVIDPIWRSSTGFTFNEDEFVLDKIFLEKIKLITPNLPEFDFMRNNREAKEFISELVNHSSLLLKGGHNSEEPGVDILYTCEGSKKIISQARDVHAKHGSGCVLSAAITGYLGLGNDLETACENAKGYMDVFLESNESLLGFHA